VRRGSQAVDGTGLEGRFAPGVILILVAVA
jgi:hypothetical protein